MKIGSTLCRTVSARTVISGLKNAVCIFNSRMQWLELRVARCEGREVGNSALFHEWGGIGPNSRSSVFATAITFRLNSSVLFFYVLGRLSWGAATFSEKPMDVGPLGEEPESVFNAGDLTWFLVCCCALSLLLGCRGVSLGMGPIGVGCRRRKQTEAVNISFQKKKKTYIHTDTTAMT